MPVRPQIETVREAIEKAHQAKTSTRIGQSEFSADTNAVRQTTLTKRKLEDLDGAVEILVFPRAFAKISSHIQANSIVHIRGVLDLKEETPKIIAEDLFPFEAIYKLITAININLSGIRENIFETLKTLLGEHRGNVPVYLRLDTPAKSRVQLIVGEGLYVAPNEKLIQDLDELLGSEHLSLVI